MTDTGLTAARRASDTTASASPAELSWPPPSDDLNAIKVVAMPGHHGGARGTSPTDWVELLPIDSAGENDLEAFRTEEAQRSDTFVARRRARVRRLLAAAVCLAAALAAGRQFWPQMTLDTFLPLWLPATPGTRYSAPPPQDAVAINGATGAEVVLTTTPAATNVPQADSEVGPPTSRPPSLPLGVIAVADRSDSSAKPDRRVTLLAPPPGTPLAPADGRLTDVTALASTPAGVGSVPPSLAPSTANPAAGLPPVPMGVVPVVDAPPAPAAPSTVRSEELHVQAALRRYEAAYTRLDAGAAQAVWPSVDARALARAFNDLDSQSLQFDRCDLDVQGATARANCRGRATYVRRVGSKTPRTDARTWNFTLRKVGNEWHILRADIR